MDLTLDSSLIVPKALVTESMLYPWTYNIDKVQHSAVQQVGDFYLFPRGNLAKLRSQFANYQIRDNRTVAYLDNPIALTGALWEDQSTWLEQWYSLCYGGLEAPCGSGKTVVGLAMLSKLNQRTLIIVNSRLLADQWKDMLFVHTDINGHQMSVMTGGSTELKPITIATWQSFISKGKPNTRLAAAKDYFGVTLIDESHRCAAPCFRSIAAQMSSRWRLHLTATPYRKDGLSPVLFDLMGPISVVGETKTLKANITYPRTECKVRFDFWPGMINYLTENAKRNILIANMVSQDIKDGHKVLVLSDRVEHCNTLGRMLLGHGHTVKVVTGKVTKKIVSETLKKLMQDELQVVVGTKIVDEGIDFPPISCLHLTCPANNRNSLKQRVGRIIRAYPGKLQPLVRDWIDVYHNHVTNTTDYAMTNIWRNRDRWYRELGYNVNF